MDGPVLLEGWATGLAITATIAVVLARTGDREGREQEVIRRVKAGDRRAFEDLMVQYQQDIYHLARRLVFNHQDADEVVQETFIKAYTRIHTYSEEYRFYTWLYRIAVNTALTLLKRRKRRGESLEALMESDFFQPAGDSNVDDHQAGVEMSERVQSALAQLSPELRSTFILRTFRELSYKEIAAALHISVGTVMSRLNRARGKLQRILKQAGGC